MGPKAAKPTRLPDPEAGGLYARWQAWGFLVLSMVTYNTDDPSSTPAHQGFEQVLHNPDRPLAPVCSSQPVDLGLYRQDVLPDCRQCADRIPVWADLQLSEPTRRVG